MNITQADVGRKVVMADGSIRQIIEWFRVDDTDDMPVKLSYAESGCNWFRVDGTYKDGPFPRIVRFHDGKAAELANALAEVDLEVQRAMARYPKMASPHEGWAVLREEVDELWDEVKKKPSARSQEKMREEAIQIAAMAIRFVVDLL